MRIDIPNNKRHFVVAEQVRNRCVVTSARTASWRNSDAVDVQLLAIGHRNRNALLRQIRIGSLRKSGHVAVKSHSCPSWRFLRISLVK